MQSFYTPLAFSLQALVVDVTFEEGFHLICFAISFLREMGIRSGFQFLSPT